MKTKKRKSTTSTAVIEMENAQIAAWNLGVTRDWSIIKQLVSKDFKLKYRRSILGVLWSVLNPLLMMVVMTIVFSNFLRFGSSGNITPQTYPLYLILGNITFALMSDATTQGMTSIISAASLLKKVKIEKTVFPIQKVLFAVVNFAFSLLAVAVVMIFLQIPLTWHAIFVPLFLVYLIIFCIGLSLLLSSLAVFFRDVIHLWGVVTLAWMYLTPIFWVFTTDFIQSPVLQQVIYWNPMYQFINYFRVCILDAQTPSFGHNLICLGFALVMFIIGWVVFKRQEHKFILYI